MKFHEEKDSGGGFVIPGSAGCRVFTSRMKRNMNVGAENTSALRQAKGTQDRLHRNNYDKFFIH